MDLIHNTLAGNVNEAAGDEAEEDESTVLAFNPSTTHSLTDGARVLVTKDSEGFWVIIWAECGDASEEDF